MTRDIFNHLGEKIGELSEPKGETWTEEQWAEKLAVFSAAPVVPPKPNISARQIRLCLLSMGITMQSIDDALESLPEPERTYAKIQWEYASEFERDNPLLINVAHLLGLGDLELDALWENAITL